MWLRWRGRGAAAELAEQRLLGPRWREVGDPGAPADGALLEDGGQVHPPPAALVSCSLQLPDLAGVTWRHAEASTADGGWRTGMHGGSSVALPPGQVLGPS